MPRSLNRDIREHAIAATDWWGHKHTVLAYELFDAMNNKLFDADLPDPIIKWDNTGRLQLREGHYHVDKDGAALYGVFDLRQDLNVLEVVLGLCHNTAHLYLETYDSKVLRKISTNGWYHPIKFKNLMMNKFGIQVDKNGKPIKLTGEFWEMLMGMEWTGYQPAVNAAFVTEFDPPDNVVAFIDETETVDEDGTETNGATYQAAPTPKPKSKMLKWTCNCEVGAIRAAVVLYALCLKCQQPYKRDFWDQQWDNDYETLQKLYYGQVIFKGGATS